MTTHSPSRAARVEPLLKPEQVADQLGITPRHVLRLARDLVARHPSWAPFIEIRALAGERA